MKQAKQIPFGTCSYFVGITDTEKKESVWNIKEPLSFSQDLEDVASSQHSPCGPVLSLSLSAPF